MANLNNELNQIYIDVDVNFSNLKDDKDIKLLFGIDSIKNSIKNIVLSNWNETPFKDKLGSNINSLVGENNTKGVNKMISDMIRTQIENNETRVIINNVFVNYKDLTYYCDINFSYKGINYNFVVYLK